MARADLISVACRRGWFNYFHYGIDIGDGTVVHLATDQRGNEMCVQRVSMESFASGSAVSIEGVVGELPPEVVVQRALEAIGKTGYHLVIGNCEHFAREMKTGKGQSVQVEMCVSSVIRTTFSGLASTAKRQVIAGSITMVSQSKTLLAAGSLVPTVVGETARQGAYLVARKMAMSHEEAERSSRSVGHAACAMGGFAVGGPAGSAAALAISVASERIADLVQRRVQAQN
jgi:hypothetical protein